MKQIIIVLLVVIALILGYNTYQNWERYHTISQRYQPNQDVDLNYFDKTKVYDYFEAIEDLNAYATIQYSSNGIDVNAPEEDDVQTNSAVKIHSEKLAIIKYYEALLLQSAKYKSEGLNNKQIQLLNEQGESQEGIEKNKAKAAIIAMFDRYRFEINKAQDPLIYEIQKLLNTKGYSLKIDGIYNIETKSVIAEFEKENNLLADGKLDLLTIETLLD